MLEIFKKGETVDLCIPTQEFALKSEWYNWFNKTEITKYLYQGERKNTPELQLEFFKNIPKDRVVFIMQTKNHIPNGVISFSKIDLKKKSADWAIVKDNSIEPELRGISALESVALLIEYGFEELGLKRITASQHTDLKKWQIKCEILGFKLEGIHENRFVKGNEIANEQTISCQYNDYFNIKNHRNGKIWDNKDKMLKRLKRMPSNSFNEKLTHFYSTERKDYYNKIFFL